MFILENPIYLYLILGLVLLALWFVYQKMSANFSKNLAQKLYLDKEPETFLKDLSSIQAKIYLSSKKRLFLALEAYMLLGQEEKIMETLDKLSRKRLGYGPTITLLQKKVQYYTESGKLDLALEAYQELEEKGSWIQDPRMLQILEESKSLVEIYCHKNAAYAEIMIDKAKQTNNKLLQGIYFYRAAKCFSYKRDKNNVVIYLKKAKEKLKGSAWEQHIEACLNDFSYLEKK